MLKRLFETNWKTSLAGLLLLGCGAAFWAGKMTASELLSAITILGGGIGLLSKDGVRMDTPVAREDVPGPDEPNAPQL